MGADGAENGGAKGDAGLPQRGDMSALEEVEHAFVFAATHKTAFMVRVGAVVGGRMAVACIPRSVQKLAPRLFFGRVRERSAEGGPYKVPWDGAWSETRVPGGFTVRSGVGKFDIVNN